jgi:hypothetical protein
MSKDIRDYYFAANAVGWILVAAVVYLGFFEPTKANMVKFSIFLAAFNFLKHIFD